MVEQQAQEVIGEEWRMVWVGKGTRSILITTSLIWPIGIIFILLELGIGGVGEVNGSPASDWS